MSFVPRVLLVEDSADDAFFFKRALTKAAVSCHFTHLTDGGAAVQLLREAQKDVGKLPDLIFLDLKMPVLSGFEVLQWLHEQSFIRKPVVVVLSGSNQETDRARAIELGAAQYLVKPVKAEDLSSRISGLLLNKPANDQAQEDTN